MGADGAGKEDLGMNPEERRAYMKKYREDHREELNAYNRKYRAEHKEENRAWQKKYREKHPENQARRLSWETCNILRAHKDALSDDPERLTTDFIMKIVKGGL